tara:strand:- start:59929 stop:60651 length:723 start_codon:yes stop_codon:yes gene_type:complete
MVNFKEFTLKDYIDLLKEGSHFTLGKFGDGELFCLFKALGWMNPKLHGESNADKHLYYKDMGLAIHDTFINEKGYFKLCHSDWFTGKGNGRATSQLFNRYIKEFNVEPPELHDATKSFYVDAEAGTLGPLKEQLEKMNFVMVSEPRKRALSIKYVDFIEVPQINAWLEKDRIKKEMIEMTEKYDNVVFGLSIGMGALPIQDELFPIIGDKCWMISFGSIFDPFINVNTRGYHSRYKNRSI